MSETAENRVDTLGAPAVGGRVIIAPRRAAEDAEAGCYHWRPAPDADPWAFDGDPTRSATFGWLAARGADPLALIESDDAGWATAVAGALAAAGLEAAALVVSPDPPPQDAAGVLRWLPPHAVAGLSPGERLALAGTLRRVAALRAFVGEVETVPVLLHDDPDPDAIASALGIRALLRRRPRQCPVVTLGDSTRRPENRRMLELLGVSVAHVTLEELGRFERIVVVDLQPAELPDPARLAVIDHHPGGPDLAYGWSDLRPGLGATATILTEYLRAEDERRIGPVLATALLYGIHTDTATLSRGAQPADVHAYAWLQERVDPVLLRRIQRPAHGADVVRKFGVALSELEAQNGVVAAFLGELSPGETHIASDLADFCLTVEGASWACVGSLAEDELVLTLRYTGKDEGAGPLAKRLAAMGGGHGGGHAVMARVTYPVERGLELLERHGGPGAAALLALIMDALQGRS
jgi:nanoRNase/pAp phosphatase (c-di-AMP/oligoRNAs hydrolase)